MNVSPEYQKPHRILHGFNAIDLKVIWDRLPQMRQANQGTPDGIILIQVIRTDGSGQWWTLDSLESVIEYEIEHVYGEKLDRNRRYTPTVTPIRGRPRFKVVLNDEDREVGA